MLTETAGSCRVETGVELGDLPINPIIRTLKLLDFVGVELFAKLSTLLSVLFVDVVTAGVDVTTGVDDSSFLTTGVLTERSRNGNVKRRFSRGLCSSDRQLVVVVELPP